jgi:hypothetical protein
VDDAMTDGSDVIVDSLERSDRGSRPLVVDERELEAGGAGVDGEDVQCGQVQSRISGSSSPCSLV